MKRIAAIVAAVTMIVVSLLIRSRLDDDSSPTPARPVENTGRIVVACVTELAGACRAAYGDSVDLRIEDAGTTATALAHGSKDLDAWVTLSGWPELLSAKGLDAPLAVTKVASTPLVIAAVKERVAVLTCTTNGWSCFLDVAGRQWSDLGGKAEWGIAQVGIAPTRSALGLLLEATAITGVVGSTDFGTNDPAYVEARTALARVDRRDDNPFNAFAVQLPARFSAVGALQADVATKSGSKADQIMTITLTPPATAIAVIARPATGRRIESDKLAKALTSAGWTIPPSDATGLPDGGVLLALSGIS